VIFGRVGRAEDRPAARQAVGLAAERTFFLAARGAIWRNVPGSWFLVPGSWFLVLGSWFLVPGSWFLVLGEV
jgi:hypothetical protein